VNAPTTAVDAAYAPPTAVDDDELACGSSPTAVDGGGDHRGSRTQAGRAGGEVSEGEAPSHAHDAARGGGAANQRPSPRPASRPGTRGRVTTATGPPARAEEVVLRVTAAACRAASAARAADLACAVRPCAARARAT
jgi:hypothetical protein